MKRNILAFIVILFFSYAINAQVYKTINIAEVNTLSTLLTSQEKSTVTHLTLTGVMDARDFKIIRDEIPNLAELDLQGVVINAYTGDGGTSPFYNPKYPADELPAYSFYNLSTATTKPNLILVVLPSNLKSIGIGAFLYLKSLKSITIPITVTDIKDNAFEDCDALTNVVIPENVKTLGISAFKGCDGLTEITLGKSVSVLSMQSFVECTNLRTVYSLNPVPPTLGSFAFQFTYLNIVYVPVNAVSAYKNAAGWNIYNIGVNELVTIDVPEAGGLQSALATTGISISTIAKLKIKGNLNSTDITYLRMNASILTELDLSEVTFTNNALPNGAFRDKVSLATIKLPESLESIGDYAFSSCTNLSSNVPLPANLKTIGKSAFYNCNRMTGSLNFPANLISIGESAFQSCTSLSGNISFPETLVSIGSSAFKGCSGLTGSLILPNSLTTLGAYAFQNCTGLNGSLQLSTQLNVISTGAFAGCSGLSGPINVPASVTTIEGSAFSNCIKLTELNLSKFVTSIGGQAFYRCYGLSKISTPAAVPPTITSSSFEAVNRGIPVEVSYGSIQAYKSASYWNTFTNFVEVIETNNLTVYSGSNGNVMFKNEIVTSGTTLAVDKNSSHVFTFAPDPNFVVFTLLYNGVNVLNQLINNQFTTPLITENSKLEVTFEKAYSVNVQIANAEGGTVSENGVNLVSGNSLIAMEGEQKTFTIMPSAGYFIESIQYGDVNIQLPLTNNQFTTTPITSNVQLNVKFKKITYDISILVNIGGSVKENGVEIANNTTLTVDQNAVKTFTIAPNAGYELDSIQYGAEKVTLKNNQFTTPPINENKLLQIAFKESQLTYDISFQIDPNGIVKENNIALSNASTLSAKVNSVKTFTITPNNGFVIGKVLYNGIDVTNQLVNGQYTTNPIVETGKLEVIFKEVTYKVSIVIEGDGKISENGVEIINSEIEVAPGSVKVFTITASTGYKVDEVYFGGNNVTSQLINNQYTTNPINVNSVLSVRFIKMNFDLKIQKNMGGVVKENNVLIADNTTLSLNAEEVKTFTILPDRGYAITSLRYNGLDVLSKLTNNTYTTPPAHADAILSVGFGQPLSYLSVDIGEGGSVEASGFFPPTDIVQLGSTTTFTIIPDPGYLIESLVYDNVNVLSQMVGNNYTTPPADKEVSTLIVRFKKMPSITIQKNAGGTITYNNTILENDTVLTINDGQTRTFTILPDTGYQVDTLYFGGVEVTDKIENNTFTTGIITDNQVLRVVFKRHGFGINILYSEFGVIKDGENVLPNDTTISVDYGSVKQFDIIPDTGYEIDTLFFGNKDLTEKLEANIFTTDSIKSNDTLKVVFKKQVFEIAIYRSVGGSIEIGENVLSNDTTISAEYGVNVEFEIIPDVGYEIDTLYFGSENVIEKLEANIFTTDSIKSNDTLKVVFKKQEFKITVYHSEGGSIKYGEVVLSNDTTVSAEYGTIQQFEIIPDVGYEVDTLYFGNENMIDQIEANIFTTDTIKSNNTLKVVFKKQVFEINISHTAGGTIQYGESLLSNDTIISAEYGTIMQFILIPETGYEVDTIYFENGYAIKPITSNVYTTDSIKSNDTLKVVFKKQEFEITINSGEGGKVKLNDEILADQSIVKADYGSEIEFIIVANKGFKIDKISYNGQSVGVASDSLSYSISAIDKDGVLEVTFKNATSVETLTNPNDIKVYTVESGIAVDGVAAGEIIRVFTLSGVQVVNTKAIGESIVIPMEKRNVYLVNIKGRTFKVILK